MKPSLQNARSGSTLILVCLVVGGACLLVGSYLGLALQRNKVALRSMAWNQAMAVAEAGIEEGLAQIQYSTTPSGGWTLSGGSYGKTRSNPFSDPNTQFTVLFSTNDPPTITATGYVRAPLLATYIKRIVQVATAKGTNLYPYGLKAKAGITLSGGASADSFDSSDPNYSTNGMYIPTRHKDNAYLVSESASAGTINVGTGKVFGYVETGAGVGTVTLSGGAVGDNNWVSNLVSTITPETGHALTNYNQDILDVALPTGLSSAPVGPTSGSYSVGGTNYTYLFGNVTNYWSGNFSIPAGNSLVVTGHATWYITGSFTMSGSAFAYLTSNSSLTIYVGTTNTSANNSVTVSGGGIANGTGYAGNLAIYGLPSVKSATFSGSAMYVGTGNVPEAKITISGGAGAAGAFVGDSVTISGSGGFHYDENLGGTPYPKYTVVSWREL